MFERCENFWCEHNQDGLFKYQVRHFKKKYLDLKYFCNSFLNFFKFKRNFFEKLAEHPKKSSLSRSKSWKSKPNTEMQPKQATSTSKSTTLKWNPTDRLMPVEFNLVTLFGRISQINLILNFDIAHRGLESSTDEGLVTSSQNILMIMWGIWWTRFLRRV